MSRVQYPRPLWERRSPERGTSTSRITTPSTRPPWRLTVCSAAQLDFPAVSNLYSDRVQPGPGQFAFVPGSATDEVDGCLLVEAAGLPSQDPAATQETAANGKARWHTPGQQKPATAQAEEQEVVIATPACVRVAP